MSCPAHPVPLHSGTLTSPFGAVLASRLACAPLAQRREDLLSTQAGSLPANFTFARTGGGGGPDTGRREDFQRGGRPPVEQSISERADSAFHSLFITRERQDVEVSVRFKPWPAGRRAGGVAVRLQARHYYVVRAKARRQFSFLSLRQRPPHREIRNLRALEQWHTLALQPWANAHRPFDGNIFTRHRQTFAQAASRTLDQGLHSHALSPRHRPPR